MYHHSRQTPRGDSARSFGPLARFDPHTLPAAAPGLDPARRSVLYAGQDLATSAWQGLGVTLVHESAARPDLDGGTLVTYFVAGTPLEHPWHLCTSAEPTAATRRFVRHVCAPGTAGEVAFHTRHPPSG